MEAAHDWRGLMSGGPRVGIYLDIDTMIPMWPFQKEHGLDAESFFDRANTAGYLGQIERYAEGFGTIVIWEAVGFWFTRSRRPAARLLAEKGALLRHMPPFLASWKGQNESTGKNAADILLAARIIDAVHTTNLDVIVLGANDKDFEPLTQELRRLGKVVVAVSPPPTGSFQKELLEWAFDEWMPLELPDAWIAVGSGVEQARQYLAPKDPVAAELGRRAVEQSRPDDASLASAERIDLRRVGRALRENFGGQRSRGEIGSLLEKLWPLRGGPTALRREYYGAIADRFLQKMADERLLTRSNDELWSPVDGVEPDDWIYSAASKLFGAEQHIYEKHPDLIGVVHSAVGPDLQRMAAAHVRNLFIPLPPRHQSRAETEARLDSINGGVMEARSDRLA